MRIVAALGTRASTPPFRGIRSRAVAPARPAAPARGPRLVPSSPPPAPVLYRESPVPVVAGAAGSRAAILEVLAACGVPFATFDARGACGGLSDAAAALLRSDGAGEATLRWAGSLAAAAARTTGVGPGADLPWTGRSPNGRLWMRARVLPPGDATRAAVVVFLPAAPEPDVPPSAHQAPDPGWGLTTREREVARLLAAGKPSKAIAATLGISTHTARRHTERVFAKLGVRCRAEVVLMLALGERAVSVER
jgi:DNA-binding CsgD family transcriptional regulator